MGSAAILPAESFDLVHARLLLINLPGPAPFVTTMVELARPGGWVALEDVDADAFVCDPPHTAWDTLRDAFLAVAAAHG